MISRPIDSLALRRTRALLTVLVLAAVALTACTSTLAPTPATSGQGGGLAGGGEGGGDEGSADEGSPDEASTDEESADEGDDDGSLATTTASTAETSTTVASTATPSSAANSDPTDAAAGTGTTSNDPVSVPTAAGPATYAPPVDADAAEGDCPYLTAEQAKLDMSQRTGTTKVRPAVPQPVCEFVRADGDFLATIRVLQFGTDAEAVAAVDYYLPRDTTNPEDRPAGWAGGSKVEEHTVTYGVSKGVWAVIAVANSDQTVRARLLVEHTIENLAL